MTLSLVSFAQGYDGKGNPPRRNRISKEEFRNQVQDFITKNAELTEEEAKAFFSIFNEYKDKQMGIHKSIRLLKKEPPQPADEDDYQESVMKIAQFNCELAELDVVYYKKLCKAVSARKFFKILSLEDQMHRNILRNYNGRQNKRGGNGNRPPRDLSK